MNNHCFWNGLSYTIEWDSRSGGQEIAKNKMKIMYTLQEQIILANYTPFKKFMCNNLDLMFTSYYVKKSKPFISNGIEFLLNLSM